MAPPGVPGRSGNFDLAASEDPQHPSVASRAGTNVTARYHVDSGLGIDDATLNGQVPRLPADPWPATRRQIQITPRARASCRRRC